MATGSSQRLRVIVKAEARKFGDAKLLAKDALRHNRAEKTQSSRRDSTPPTPSRSDVFAVSKSCCGRGSKVSLGRSN